MSDNKGMGSDTKRSLRELIENLRIESERKKTVTPNTPPPISEKERPVLFAGSLSQENEKRGQVEKKSSTEIIKDRPKIQLSEKDKAILNAFKKL